MLKLIIKNKILLRNYFIFLLKIGIRLKIINLFKSSYWFIRLESWSNFNHTLYKINIKYDGLISNFIKINNQNYGINKNNNLNNLNLKFSKEKLSILNIEQITNFRQCLSQCGYFISSYLVRLYEIERRLEYCNEEERDSLLYEVYFIGKNEHDKLMSNYNIYFRNINIQLKKMVTQSFDYHINKYFKILRTKSEINFIKQINKNNLNTVEIYKKLFNKKIDGLGNKKILLIGPSFRETDTKNYYDFDYIARVGYTGSESVSTLRGCVTSMSFYKDEKFKQLLNQSAFDWSNELQFIILSGINPDKINLINIDKNIYYSNFTGEILDGYECNAGLEALLYLLDNGVGEIKLINFDLFLNPRYPSGYLLSDPMINSGDGSIVVPNINSRRSMAIGHPPFMQFAAYKCAQGTGRLKGDSEFESIMNNGLLDYLYRLEIQYSDNNKSFII